VKPTINEKSAGPSEKRLKTINPGRRNPNATRDSRRELVSVNLFDRVCGNTVLPVRPMRLPLDSTGCDSLNNVSLEKQEQDEHGNYRKVRIQP
jgi:hypothetical protein